MTHIKLLNGDLIPIEDDWNERDILEHLSNVLDISPYRIRLMVFEESKESKVEEKDGVIRCALVVEKDRVKIPCPLDQLTNYTFLVGCQHVPTLRTCIDRMENNPSVWHDLVKNPHPLIVDHLLSLPDLHLRLFVHELSANPNDRIVNWLIDHPNCIFNTYFFRNPNPRAIEYFRRTIRADVSFRDFEKYSPFLCNVAKTVGEIEWAHSLLVPHTLPEKQFVVELCRHNRSGAVREWFVKAYPTPESAFVSGIYTLPQSYDDEAMIPYYLYYLEHADTVHPHVWLHDLLAFLATHPHPSCVEWWIRNIDENRDLSANTVGNHLRSLHSNPSDTIVDWLSTGDKPFFDVYMFANNPNPRAVDMCLEKLRKGWGKNLIDMFLHANAGLGGMHPRVVKFLFNEYPDECRLEMTNGQSRGYLPNGFHRLSLLDDWEEWVM